QLYPRALGALLHRRARRDLEGDRTAIDLMEIAVIEGDLGVDHREADQNAGIPHALDALLDGGNEVPRHAAADNSALKLVAGAGQVRLDLKLDAGELAGAARLLLVGIVDVARPGDGLAIGNLRRPDVDLDLVRPLQDVDLDVEVQLAHALDDRLTA